MSSSELRELFEACKTGDLIKVKKLLTQQNVNEIGESQGRNDGLKDGLTFDDYFRHCGSTLDCLALRQRLREERCCRTSASKRCQHRGQGRRRLEPSSQVSQPLNALEFVSTAFFSLAVLVRSATRKSFRFSSRPVPIPTPSTTGTTLRCTKQ